MSSLGGLSLKARYAELSASPQAPNTKEAADLKVELREVEVAPCEALQGWLSVSARHASLTWRAEVSPQEDMSALSLSGASLKLAGVVSLPLPPLTLELSEPWRPSLPKLAWRSGALWAQQGLSFGGLGERGWRLTPSLGWWSGALAGLEVSRRGEPTLSLLWSERAGAVLEGELKGELRQPVVALSGQLSGLSLWTPQGAEVRQTLALSSLPSWAEATRSQRAELWVSVIAQLTPRLTPHLVLSSSAARVTPLSGRQGGAVPPWRSALSLSWRSPSASLSAHLGAEGDPLEALNSSERAQGEGSTQGGEGAQWGASVRGRGEQRRWLGPLSLTLKGEGSARLSELSQAGYSWLTLSLGTEAHRGGHQGAHRGAHALQSAHLKLSLDLEWLKPWRAWREALTEKAHMEALQRELWRWGELPPHQLRLGVRAEHLWRLKGWRLSLGGWGGVMSAVDGSITDAITALNVSALAQEQLTWRAWLSARSERLEAELWLHQQAQAPSVAWRLSAPWWRGALWLSWRGRAHGMSERFWGDTLTPTLSGVHAPLNNHMTNMSEQGGEQLSQALTLSWVSSPLSVSLSLWSEAPTLAPPLTSALTTARPALALGELSWADPCGCVHVTLRGGLSAQGEERLSISLTLGERSAL